MKNIKYIGVDDLDIDLFESQYVVPEGMSYNSYLIEDEKIAVMDTADRRKGDEWKAKLAEALAGRQPDYLVAHHMEPDHASLIAEALRIYPGMKLVCSAQALKMLPNFFVDFPSLQSGSGIFGTVGRVGIALRFQTQRRMIAIILFAL